MLDLGLSFLGSVARDPGALAIVDGDVRLSYAQWYRRISALVAGFDAIVALLMPLHRILFVEANPIPLKRDLSMLDLTENELRLPLTQLSHAHEEQLRRVLADISAAETRASARTDAVARG